MVFKVFAKLTAFYSGGGGKQNRLLENLFSVSYKFTRGSLGILSKKYKIIKILFFKFSFKELPLYGRNNKIFLSDNENNLIENKVLLPEINISVEGDNNIVILPKNYASIFKHCTIFIHGDNNKIEIKNSDYGYYGLTIDMRHKYKNRIVKIEKNCSFSDGDCINCLGDNTEILVGEDNMFAMNVKVWSSDCHPIYDSNTKERINQEKSIRLGKHVWLGIDSKILKGATVPDGCVVGANSIVNKEFSEPNCILAGMPAKIIKKNIRWER